MKTERIPGQRDKFKPYIRRMNGREKSNDFRTSIRLSIFGPMREIRNVYVMVQKGFPNEAIAVGLSKSDIKQSILVVRCGRKTFNEWANDTKVYAQKKRLIP